jgi:AcrR family transcriptional regulator
VSARPTYHHGGLAPALRAAARDELRDRGPAGFRLRAVARAVGVDVAAVYRHYRDKDDLLAALAAEGFEELGAALDAAAAAAPSPRARLAAVGEAYVAFALADPARFRLLFGPAAAAPRCAGGPGRASAALREALEALAAAGGLRGPLPECALAAWSAVHGLATLAVDGLAPGGPEAAAAVVRRALEGIAGAEAPQLLSTERANCEASVSKVET